MVTYRLGKDVVLPEMFGGRHREAVRFLVGRQFRTSLGARLKRKGEDISVMVSFAELICDALRFYKGQAGSEEIISFVLANQGRLNVRPHRFRHRVTNTIWQLKKDGYIEETNSSLYKLLSRYHSAKS